MSDLQDLIHTNAHNAFEIGVRTERDRIIKQLQSKRCECLALSPDEHLALLKRDKRLSHNSCEWTFLSAVMELIEETK
jgi:hypothetical protein